ncbi:hypothetical protein [Marimonas lutisalis]|uniref:hypothetical protein n=1 Tax=Marimonas lutisalis TaxID=2545756 RepID=UPI0010F8BFC4|nr:hypothetical protein [Marimonas lutisalis]
MGTPGNDRIYVLTRVVAGVIIPFLVLAFLILYFFPEESGERFAYRITPPAMAAYIGAGYLGGAYLFAHVLAGRRWHRVALGFPPVTAFTISMLLVTYLHWNRYSVDDLPFQLWLGLYVVTPVLVPAIWLYNRGADHLRPEPGDVEVARAFRIAVRLFGLAMAAIVIVGFTRPDALMAFWPWRLSELTARLLSGWGALLAVANIYISFETRWSAWRVGVESIALWHALFLVSAFMHPEDFNGGRLANWYVLSVIAVLVLMAIAYVAMETRRRRNLKRPA